MYMKRNLYITLLLLTMVASASIAAEKADTATVIREIGAADRLVISEDAGGVTINVTGVGGKTDSTFIYRQQFSSDAMVETSQKSNDWNVISPFDNNKSTHKKGSIAITTGGIALGFSSAVGAPSGLNFDLGKSVEIMWINVLGGLYYFSKHDNISMGLGLDWRNYRLDESQRFYQNDDGSIYVGPYENENSWNRQSRIKTFSMLVPVMYSHSFDNDFNITAGVILDFNTYASVKTKYQIADDRFEDFSSDIPHNTITCDFMAKVSWNDVGIYAKYSPCNVLKSSLAPKFNSLSFGLIFFY